MNDPYWNTFEGRLVLLNREYEALRRELGATRLGRAFFAIADTLERLLAALKERGE